MPDTLSDVPAFPMKRDCPFDPPPELSRIQAENPVSRVRLWDGSRPWLITGYDDMRGVLADRRFSADVTRPGYPHVTAASEARRKRSRTFISMDEPEHGTYRKMLTSTFMIKKVESLRPRIQAIVDGLIDAMLDGTPPADLVAAFALPVPSLVICELLGVPYADHDFFQRCSRILVSSRSTPEQALAAADELKAYLSSCSAARRRTRRRPAQPAGRRTGAGDDARAARRHGHAPARRRARDDREHDRAGHARRCSSTPTSSPSCATAGTRSWSRARSRNCCATSTSCTAAVAASPPRTSRSAGS